MKNKHKSSENLEFIYRAFQLFEVVCLGNGRVGVTGKCLCTSGLIGSVAKE